MSVLGWVSQENELAEHDDDLDAVDDVDTVDDVDAGDDVDEASSSWTMYCNDEDEESNNDNGSDTDSEYDFSFPPTCEEDIASAGNDSLHDMSSFPAVESRLSAMESHTGSPMNPISNEDSVVTSTAPTSSTNASHVGNIEPESVQQTSSTLPKWHGFKLVGDNIDKNVRPSFSRSDKSTQSLHCFHYYAALDRVNLSSFSDATPNMEVDAEKLLINQEDIAQLQSDAVTLISR